MRTQLGASGTEAVLLEEALAVRTIKLSPYYCATLCVPLTLIRSRIASRMSWTL